MRIESREHIKLLHSHQLCENLDPQPSSEAPDQLNMNRESRAMETKKQEGVIALRGHGIALPTSE